MPYDWSPRSKCPKWLKFLQEIFPNDPQKIDLLQEWFGYNLVADTSAEKLMFFVGRPGAGKGTVLEALRAVLGSGQVASTSFDTLVSDFGLQPLLGKLAAILPDAHITRRGDPAKALQVLKEISGRDGIGINRKNKDRKSVV
jgi:putative DNA primase/helicase